MSIRTCACNLTFALPLFSGPERQRSESSEGLLKDCTGAKNNAPGVPYSAIS